MNENREADEGAKGWLGMGDGMHLAEHCTCIHLADCNPGCKAGRCKLREPGATINEGNGICVPAPHQAAGEGAVAAERERWLRWASRRACCKAGLVAAPDPCPWHDPTTT